MKKERITTIDLWKFLLVVGIAIGNLNNLVWKNTGKTLIFTGSAFITFFMFISGYYLVKHYKDNNSKKNPSIKAWSYTKERISKLYPALLGGVAFAFVIRNIIFKTKITRIITVFMNSIWEFLGLSQVTFGTLSSTTILWNEPLWYISTLVISGLILYYILAKNEDFFVGLFAPLMIVFTYFSIGLDNLGLNPTSKTILGFIPESLIRVMAGLCVGALIYYIVDYLKKKKFSETMLMTFSVLHIVLAMFLIYTCYAGFSWNNLTHSLFIFIFCIILLTNKDYVAVLYNNSKICYMLGRLALYFFSCHIVFIYFLSWCFPEMGYYPSIIFNVLFSTCWAFIMMYVDDYVISPIFRKKIKN